MKKEYLPLAIIFVILIALNIFLDTFPLEGIISVGGVVCFLLYLGNIRSQQDELKARVTQLENYIKNKEQGE